MMKILKNRIFAASLILLLLTLAGGFIVMAPLLVILRNEFSNSAMALKLWPIIRPEVIGDILINRTESLAAYAVAALVILSLYAFISSYFIGGVYSIIVANSRSESGEFQPATFSDFLRRSAELWPGFLKLMLFSIIVYGIALFLGLTLGQILGGIWNFLRFVTIFILFLAASSYLQILRSRMAATGDNSLRNAIRATRDGIRKSFVRLLAGNISVALAGLFAAFIFWIMLKGIRGFNWSILTAALSIILEQAIVFIICLHHAIRINFNHSIIEKGESDVMGGNKLG